LEVHHIVEQAKGGKHELWNLTLLCTGHHSALHNGLLVMTGQAPYQIEFRWVYGDPIPVGLDPDTRRNVIGQRYVDALEMTRELWAKELESEPGGIWCSIRSQLGRRGRRRGTWSRPAAKSPAAGP
jgi:hypothetical protein